MASKLGNRSAARGLTDAKIKALKPPEKGQVEHVDAVVKGLRLRIGAGGVKTFIVRKKVAGKAVNLTIGRYHPRTFTLAHARKRARDIVLDLQSGKTPPKPVVKRGAQGTVRTLAEDYFAAEVRGHKRSADDIERVFNTYIFPEIGDRMADSITRGDVTRLIDGVVNANPEKPRRAQGRQVHAMLSSFYSWALPRLDALPANPCRDAGRPPPSKARERVLTEAEIKAFWQAAGEMGYPFGGAFRLLALTATRRSEVFNADRSEIDISGKVWTIPPERAKNGVEHIIPLNAHTLRVIESLPMIDKSTKLFPARGNSESSASGFSKATANLKAKMAERLDVDAVEHFVLHDLRRTAATNMQRIGITLPVVEAVLNHVSGSRAGIVGVYQRHKFEDEKRHALEAWAAEIDRIVNGRERGNVVKLKARANDG